MRLVLLRHLFAILALPFVVAVVVPLAIARRSATSFAWPSGAADAALLTLGIGALGIGLALFASSLYQFASRGRGTLAPWDPPTRLVVDGPYRYVRNPMISGVLFLLLGEAAVLRSMPHLTWAIAFLAINAIYIPLVEEPKLARRFGDPYRVYCRNVRRLVPRLKPWTP